MRTLIEAIARRMGKSRRFRMDPALSELDVIQLLGHLGVWTVRGLWYRLLFGRASGVVMVGRQVRIRYPRHLYVGKNFIVEDFAEIMGLSRRGIHCGDNVTIGAYTMIKPSGYYGANLGEGLTIGDNSNIGRYSYIGCSGLITIGRDVMISPRVSMYAENHNFAALDRPMREQGITREPIVIEDDCWIASGSMILAGVTIGRGSIVAAGSVVTADVPPRSVAAGAPARVIRTRDDNHS